MSTEIICALLALFGTVTGSLSGILIANKLTNYRIEQLEKKVEKHNNLIERVVIIERDVKTVWKSIDELKERKKDIQ